MPIAYLVPNVDDYSEGLDWYYHSVYSDPNNIYNYVWVRLCNLNNSSDTVIYATHYDTNDGIATLYASNKSSAILSYKASYSSSPITQWSGLSETRNDNLAFREYDSGVYFTSAVTSTNVVDVYLPTDSVFDSYQSAVTAIIHEIGGIYPITYHYTNSTVSGPSSAAVGDTVTVSAVPDVGYGIINASTQILVTNDDVAVPYTWDAQSNQITFTMPQPATNRGGFGSTGH